MMTDETTMKNCSRGDKCVHPMGCWQPATNEYFSRNKGKSDGFQNACKVCAKAYRDSHREELNEYARNYREANKEKVRQKNKAWYAANKDRVREYRATNRERISNQYRAYQVANREKINEINRKHYRNHRAEMRERKKLAYRRDRIKWKERFLQWKSDNPEKWKVNSTTYSQNRRARKLLLPDTLTTTQWQRAIDYFNGCCAVCGRPLRDLFGTHTAAIDHWIALTDPREGNPGTVATNAIPLCHGENGCNNRKRNRDPKEFLETEFGKRRAREILKRIETYFQWVREQDGGD